MSGVNRLELGVPDEKGQPEPDVVGNKLVADARSLGTWGRDAADRLEKQRFAPAAPTETAPPQPVAKAAATDQSAITAPVKRAIEGTRQPAQLSDDYLSKVGRVGLVTGNGILKSGVGLGNAIANDWEHPENVVAKVAGGMVVGGVMKTALPAKGVMRGIAGGVMLGFMAIDLAKPVVEGWSTAWSSRNSKELDKASDKMGDGLGAFAWDSAIGIGGGIAGERLTGRLLQKSLGQPRYTAFESWKETQFEKREGVIGRFLVPASERTNDLLVKVKDTLAPEKQQKVLSPEERMQAYRELVDHLEHEGRHLMYKSRDFSPFLDGLTGEGPQRPAPVVSLINNAEANQRALAMMARTPKDVPPDVPDGGPPASTKGGDMPAKPPELGDMPGQRKGPDVAPAPDDVVLGKTTPHGKAPTNPGDGTPGPVPGKPTGDKPTSDKTPGEQPGTTTGDKAPADKPGTTTGDTTGKTDKPVDPADGKVKVEVPVAKQTDAGDVKPRVANPFKTTTTAAEEISPEVIGALGREAKARQDKWAHSEEAEGRGEPSPASLADFRDMTKGPIVEVSDANRKGALLPPEFEKSAGDLAAIIDEVKSAEILAEVGPLMQWHALAANQILLRDRDVLALDMLADEIFGTFLANMRKIKVKENVLENHEPSVVAKADDRGSGNFTVPRQDGVLRRAGTIVPRNQEELISVLASNINYHEHLGHDHVFPVIAMVGKTAAHDNVQRVIAEGINDSYRKDVIMAAVKEAFSKKHIEDSDMHVGDQVMKKSQVFTDMLIAEANENTADMVGTAASGLGTPLSLGTLLQSLRPGGVLETRNVFGKQFSDTYEPHGFDRWRIKLAAQTMRHLGKGDKVIDSYADALDAYAAKASRPGDEYVFASMDQKGQLIRIKQDEWDAIIPHIVKTQFDTPLPALDTPTGMKTLTDVVPNFAENFHKTNELATAIADAANRKADNIENFDKEAFRNKYTIGNVFNANLLAWSRAKARGQDASEALDGINKIWANMRDVYIEKNPHHVPFTQPTIEKLKAAPIATIATGVVRGTGNLIGSTGWRTTLQRNATMFGGSQGAVYGPELLGLHARAQQMIEEHADQFATLNPPPAVPR